GPGGDRTHPAAGGLCEGIEDFLALGHPFPRLVAELQPAWAVQFARHGTVHQILPDLLMGAVDRDVVQHGSIRPVGGGGMDTLIFQGDQVHLGLWGRLIHSSVARLRRWWAFPESTSQLRVCRRLGRRGKRRFIVSRKICLAQDCQQRVLDLLQLSDYRHGRSDLTGRRGSGEVVVLGHPGVSRFGTLGSRDIRSQRNNGEEKSTADGHYHPSLVLNYTRRSRGNVKCLPLIEAARWRCACVTVMLVRTTLMLLICGIAVASSAADFGQAGISNGTIDAKLYLPDLRSGYYRGTRFDWSGVIHSLRFQGHEYFGPWFERYDPKTHDAITGPVEEFLSHDAGLGYQDA